MKQKKADEVLISIIVPVFNTSKYLVKCLESIRLAMFENCEVIIINDGSTDDSEKIVKDYIKSLPKEIINQFKYIFKKNAGLADTKNVGISKSKGKYISVIDSDDYISTTFYSDCLEFLLDDYDMIVYDLYLDYENNKEYNHTSRAIREDRKDFKSQLLFGAMQGSSCNKIIKKSLYKYEFPIGVFYEDVAVTPFIISDSSKIKYIPNPNYYYLQRSNSIVASHKYYEAYIKIVTNIYDTIKKYNLNINKYEDVINSLVIEPLIDNFSGIVKNNWFLFKYKKILKKFITENSSFFEKIYDYKLFESIIVDYSTQKRIQLKRMIYCISKQKYCIIIFYIKLRLFVNWIRTVVNYKIRGWISLFGGMYKC